MTATIFGHKAVFCNPSCRDSFREDRKHGLIYGPSAVRNADGTIKVSKNREEWSRDTGCCAYCGR